MSTNIAKKLGLGLIFLLGGLFLRPQLASAAALSAIPGKVIYIKVAGTDVPWVVSNYQDSGYTMVMAMTNVCSISQVGCTTYAGAASTTGTAWNATSTTTDCTAGSTTGRCNQLASLKTYNYLTQMDNVWKYLGGTSTTDQSGTIGGVAKATAVRNTTWDMDGFSSASPAVRSNAYNANQTKYVNLVSFYEWQIGKDDGSSAPTISYSAEPATNSLGNLFCAARYGTACLGTNIYSTYNSPWARSATSGNTSRAWYLYGSTSNSLGSNRTSNAYGLLPVIWVSSTINTACGSGTYSDPYRLNANECNTAPSLPSITWDNSGWKNGNISLSGTVTDADSSQTLTIQYQWDGVGGTWTDLTSKTSPASAASWGAVSIATPASNGAHTLYLRVGDGTAYSTNYSATYNVDKTAPTCGTTWSPASPVAWKTAAATQVFTLTGSSDTGGSGISNTSYTCTAAATHNATCSITIADNAGNTTSCGNSPANRIDLTNPSCAAWTPSTDTWSKTSTTFTMAEGTAGGSAISSYNPSNRQCAATGNNGTCSVTITAESGRTATCTSPKNLVDTTAPSIAFANPASGSTWYKALQTPTVTATDAGVGMTGGSSVVRYAWNSNTNISASTCTGGTALTNGTAVSTSGQNVNSANTLYVCAMDNLGNIGYATATYNIDTTAPTCSGWLSASSGYTSDTSTWRQSGAETWRMTCTDEGGAELSTTAVEGTYVSAGVYSCTTGTANGNTCTIQVKDNAANNSTTYTSPVNNVDSANPGITLNPASSATWSKTDITPTITATSTSGISVIRYSWTAGDLAADCSSGGTAISNGGNAGTAAVGGATLYVCVKNNAGTVVTDSGTYNVDKTTPTCGTWTPATDSYFSTNAAVTAALASSTDAGGSGINVAGGTTANITPTAAGATGTVTISDNAGNTTTCTSKKMILDNTAPTFTTNPNPNNPSWSKTDIAVTLTAADTKDGTNAGSGVKEIRYSWNNTPTLDTTDCTGGTLLSSGGSTTNAPVGGATLTVCVIDNVGNIYSSSGTYNVDKTAPVCNTSVWNPSESAWHNNATGTTFTLVSGQTDAGGSGLDTTWNAANNTCTTGTTHGATCDVTVRDNAGNTTACTSPINRVSDELPVITLTNSDDVNWFNSNRSSVITVKTNASGLAAVRYAFVTGANPVSPLAADCSTGGTLLSMSGDSTGSSGAQGTTATAPVATSVDGARLFVCAKDVAGNVTTNFGYFKIDKEAPICPAQNAVNWTPYPAPWQVAGITTFSMTGATDAGYSGLLVDSGTCNTGDTHNSTCGDTTHSGSGKIVIVDNAGNSTACDSPANRLDNEAPTSATITTTGSETGTDSGSGANYTNNQSVSVSFGGSVDLPASIDGIDNAGIPVNPYTYTLSGAENTEAEVAYVSSPETPVLITAEGETTVMAWASDRVGNQSLPASVTVKLDRTQPFLTMTLTGGEQAATDVESGAGTGVVYQASPAIKITATDPNNSNATDGSGIAGLTTVWLQDTTPTSSDMVSECSAVLNPNSDSFVGWGSSDTITTQIPADGVHTLCSRSIDNAGNPSEVRADSFALNTQNPTLLLTVDLPSPEVVDGWYLSEPAFTLTATDNNGSGIKNITYLLIPTSEALSNSAKYDAEYDVTADTDTRIVTVEPVNNSAATFVHQLNAPTISEGNYTLFAATTDNTSAIAPSPTLRENIAVDKQKPVAEFGYQATPVSIESNNPNYLALGGTGVTNIIESNEAELDLTFFDPLSSDVTSVPADILMTSGVKSCTLQYRSVPIRTDGTGLLQTDAASVLEWSDWTTDANYSLTDCEVDYVFEAQNSTAYQLRLLITDNAGWSSDIVVSDTLIYNLPGIFQPGFNDLDNNVPVNQIQNNIIKMDCTNEANCDTAYVFPATMSQDLTANTYEVCLNIIGTDITKCQTVTSSTTGVTHYNFSLLPSEFPSVTDVFIGGTLTTTLLDAGTAVNSFTTSYNAIIFIERGRPPIVKATKTNNYVFMRNGKAN